MVFSPKIDAGSASSKWHRDGSFVPILFQSDEWRQRYYSFTIYIPILNSFPHSKESLNFE